MEVFPATIDPTFRTPKITIPETRFGAEVDLVRCCTYVSSGTPAASNPHFAGSREAIVFSACKWEETQDVTPLLGYVQHVSDAV